jgi:hypothetical protein
MQLIFLGIMGEYIGRLYGEAKRRPLYLVRERLGFAESHRADLQLEQRTAARSRQDRRAGRERRRSAREPRRADPRRIVWPA